MLGLYPFTPKYKKIIVIEMLKQILYVQCCWLAAFCKVRWFVFVLS